MILCIVPSGLYFQAMQIMHSIRNVNDLESFSKDHVFCGIDLEPSDNINSCIETYLDDLPLEEQLNYYHDLDKLDICLSNASTLDTYNLEFCVRSIIKKQSVVTIIIGMLHIHSVGTVLILKLGNSYRFLQVALHAQYRYGNYNNKVFNVYKKRSEEQLEQLRDVFLVYHPLYKSQLQKVINRIVSRNVIQGKGMDTHVMNWKLTCRLAMTDHERNIHEEQKEVLFNAWLDDWISNYDYDISMIDTSR